MPRVAAADLQMIRDAAERYLAEACTPAAVRRAVERPEGFDPAVWAAIGQEQGWCGLAIPEACGGLGLGPEALVVVQEQAGRHLLPGPFFATVCVAAPVIEHCALAGRANELLTRIASGGYRLGVALHGSAERWERKSRRLQAEPVGEHWRLSGEARAVCDAVGADDLLLMARDPEDRPGLFRVARAAEGVAVTARPGWDATRSFGDVVLSKALAERLDSPERGLGGLRVAAAKARLYLAAELLGVAQACLDLTLAYTAERKQFGRAIASFQAVKHRCAQMMVRIESLRSAVAGAAARLSAEPAPEAAQREGLSLKIRAADTAFWCAQEAIQLHGGVGFTWEYEPQRYFKRARAALHWLGHPDELRAELADALLDAPEWPSPLGGAAPDESAEDRSFRAEVAEWMAAHLSGPYAVLRDRGGPGDEAFEPELRKAWERELASGGWTCVGWPQAHGGRGLNIRRQVIFHEEYARAGGPGRMGHIGEGLIGPAIIAYGTTGQQRRFLPDIVAGRVFWAQGYSEPGAGSDLANVQTRAVQDPDGSWRVFGQKIWTSLAHESDWIFVLARCEPGSRGNKGLIFLLMPLDQPGITLRPIRQLNGGCEFNEVFFDGARCAASDVLGAPGEGWKVAMGLLEIERGVSTLGQQMRFAHELECVVQAARKSGVIARPAFRARLAEAWAGLAGMRDNALRMLADGAELGLRREALIYKYDWSNWHRALGELAMDALDGESPFVLEDDLGRTLQQLFFFSRADTIYAGTNEIQLNLIAERGLGMPREPRPAPVESP